MAELKEAMEEYTTPSMSEEEIDSEAIKVLQSSFSPSGNEEEVLQKIK